MKAKDDKTPKAPESPEKKKETPKPDANLLLQRFLLQYKVGLEVQVMNKGIHFTGDGLAITEKPLLKIIAKYTE